MSKLSQRVELTANFLIIVVALVIFSKISFGQDDVILVDTNLVTVPVTILDRDGRYVTNLKKRRFSDF